MSRDYTKYRTWLKNEFKPLTLATPDATLDQIVENSARYFNNNSAYKITTMVDYAPGTKMAQLNSQFKTVVDIYPSKTTTWINEQVHEKAAQFGELLRVLRKYRARLLNCFNNNGVTTTFPGVTLGATAAGPCGRWYSLNYTVTCRGKLKDLSASRKVGHKVTACWNDHCSGGFAGRPALKNSVKCGNIRGSQTTRYIAVTRFECGQSATKLFAKAA